MIDGTTEWRFYFRYVKKKGVSEVVSRVFCKFAAKFENYGL